MDLNTDEDMGHLWKMLDLAELPAGTESAFSSIRAQRTHIFQSFGHACQVLVLLLWLCFCLRAEPGFHFSNQIKECKVTEQNAGPTRKRWHPISSSVANVNRRKLISLQKGHVGLSARMPGESQLCQIEEISLLRCLGDCREKSGQFLKAWALCYTSTGRNRAELLQFLS